MAKVRLQNNGEATGSKINISFGCRTKKPVWGCFESYLDGKSRKAKCVYCGSSMRAEPEKMLDHIIRRCKSIPPLIKSVWKKSDDFELQERAILPTSISTKLDDLLTKNPVPLKQKAKYFQDCGITGPFNHQLSDQIIDRIHDDIVIALITSCIPLTFVNNPFFRRAFDRLAGGMKHIDDQYAKTIVFNRIHEKVMEEMVTFIEASGCITVICRSFSNTAGIPITSFILVNNANSSELLHKMKGSIANNASSVYKNLMIYAKALSADQSDHNKIMFCGDGTSVSCSIRQMLKASQEVSFSLVGCCMINQSNLFLKDLMTVTPTILYAIDSIIKLALFIRKSKQFRAAILARLKNDVGIEVQILPLSIPSLTHLYSIGVMMKQIIDLQKAISSAMATEKSKTYLQRSKLAKTATQLVENNAFWDGLKEIYNFLKPFNILTELCAKQSPTSGQILFLWIWLIIVINTTEILSAKEKSAITKVFIQRIHNYAEDHYFACYLLHPAIRGAGLSAVGKQEAQKSIYTIAARISPYMDMQKLMFQLSNYLYKTGTFYGKNIWLEGHIKNAKVFWDGFSFIRELQLIANQVISYKPLVLFSDNNWLSSSNMTTTTHEQSRKFSVQNAFKRAQISHHYRYESVPSTTQEIEQFKKLFMRPDITPRNDSGSFIPSKTTQHDDTDVIMNYQLYDPVTTLSLENILECDHKDDHNDTVHNNTGYNQAKETNQNKYRLTFASALEKLSEENIALELVNSDIDQFCIQRFNLEWLNCNETGLTEINEALNNLING